nr:MAG TPA: hypothetical protein [Caudoviricetes sp.]
MRLIDVDKITNKDIRMVLGSMNASRLHGIRELLDEQPTVKPPCVATINIKKEEIKEMIDQKFAQSIELNYDLLKELLMEYFRIGVDCYTYNLTRDKSAFECGTVTVNDFEEFDEEMIDDIIDFVKSRT